MATDPLVTAVLVDATRLAKLEALEARAHAQQVKDFERLRASDTTEKKQERVRRHRDKDRDAYNAKQRERRRIVKEQKVAALAAEAEEKPRV